MIQTEVMFKGTEKFIHFILSYFFHVMAINYHEIAESSVLCNNINYNSLPAYQTIISKAIDCKFIAHSRSNFEPTLISSHWFL